MFHQGEFVPTLQRGERDIGKAHDISHGDT
jgi:hypothetical protein